MVRLLAVVVALLAMGESAARAVELTYVAAGDVHEVSVVSAPLPAVAFGAFSVAALEAAAGRPAAPRVLVPVARGAVNAPLAAPLLGDVTRERVAAVRLRRTFQVGDELARLRVLRLRVRYQDGLVATLNDVEIARRNIPADAAPEALAQRTRGGEWEAIFLPAGDLLRRGENVLQIEVRPSAARLAPVADVELVAAEAARVVRGPILGRVGPDRATVVFETDVPTLGEVRLPGRVLPSGTEPAMRHVVEIDGLSAGQEVSYQVAVTLEGVTEVGPAFSFHAAPAPGEPVRFVVYGDVRSGHAVHADLLRAVVAEAPDFLLATGDMVLRGTDEGEWQKFFDIAGGVLARLPLYPSLGNHDLGATSGRERRFEDVFALPERPADCPPGAAWYALDVAGVHVLMLDSNHYRDDRQLSWLAGELARARDAGARAIFAVVHHGPFARGPHGGDPFAVERYVPLLVEHGVTMLFSGHDHIYQRGRKAGLDYIVSGGGGASLYPVTCGVPGRPPCKSDDGAATAISAYHYVLVEVLRDDVRVCPKRIDGTALEPCVRLDLPGERARR